MWSSRKTESTCWSPWDLPRTWTTPTHIPREFHRADVLEYTPEGKFEEIYAYGIRNCVGEAINPGDGHAVVLGERARQPRQPLVPDYVTSVPEQVASSAGRGITWADTRTRG